MTRNKLFESREWRLSAAASRAGNANNARVRYDLNIASREALQKTGFEREGALKRAAIKNGKVMDAPDSRVKKAGNLPVWLSRRATRIDNGVRSRSRDGNFHYICST
ncbi:MAG: hypothetical protein LBG30_02025 [Odoribacteraceae bacterium]|jgi:hypothetical protein|nr:hypothetical protein [Odoribacteraceae bacterium]